SELRAAPPDRSFRARSSAAAERRASSATRCTSVRIQQKSVILESGGGRSIDDDLALVVDAERPLEFITRPGRDQGLEIPADSVAQDDGVTAAPLTHDHAVVADRVRVDVEADVGHLAVLVDEPVIGVSAGLREADDLSAVVDGVGGGLWTAERPDVGHGAVAPQE